MVKGTIDKIATGRAIKEEMDAQGITYRDMSNALDISFQAVWKYCEGQSLPTLVNFYKISQILGVSINDFIKEK